MWNPSPIDDGDDASAASVNNRLSGARDWINDLTAASLRRGCFNPDQAASMLAQTSSFTATSGNQGSCLYTTATFGDSITWNSYGFDGGAETAPEVGTEDRSIIGHPTAAAAGTYTGGVCKVTMPGSGYRVGYTNGSRVTGILCRLNCEVRRIIRGAAGTGIQAMVCVQYQVDGAGTWWTVPESESFVTSDDHMLDSTSTTEKIRIDVPIATLILPSTLTADGLTPGTNRVTGVRGMVSLVNGAADSQLEIHEWVLSAAPIRGKI